MTSAEFAEFFRHQPYKLVPHSFKRRFLSWAICSGCGLLYFRNPLTTWAIKKGCNYDDHPQFKTQGRRVRA